MSEADAVVLVTGGTGFIGTWVLRECLRRSVRTIAFDVRPNDARWQRILGESARNVTFAAGSLVDRDRVLAVCDEHHVTHLVHLAALLTPACQDDPWTGCEVNVLGSLSVLEVARRRAERIRGLSYASSYAVYGPEADDLAAGTSAADNRPPTFYGAFKLAVDQIAEQYWRHYRVRSIGIRPHVVYGPERDQGLTAGPSLASRAAARGESFTIGYRGRVGYDYVEDVAQAFVRAALECPAETRVVDLPGPLASSEEFAETITRVAGMPPGTIRVDGPLIPSNIPPQPYYIDRLFADWRTTSLAEGVQRTIEFYRQSH